jgi:RNA 3'-terminal phosphate cyclase (ATP)
VENMLVIDGGLGEGGGQVLRTCLALSLFTGKGFTLMNIRQGRKNPGLRAQHLNAVRLAAKVGNARVEGADFGSTRLRFSPQSIRTGNFTCDIGTAGSTSLVLQTIYLPLSFGEGPSELNISGGTHVPFAPTFDFLNMHWMTYIKRIGFQLSINLGQAGFYPHGGGQIRALINPSREISGFTLTQRGSLKQIYGISSIANLDRSIAERQRDQIIRLLGKKYPLNDIRIQNLPSHHKGTTICLVCQFEHSQCCYSSLGKAGKPAEFVTQEVCDKIEYFLSTQAVMDEYLSDQLLLPLSIAGVDSHFSTAKITDHLRTNADIIKLFVDRKIEIVGTTGSEGLVSIIL